jgi:hypothetical protein
MNEAAAGQQTQRISAGFFIIEQASQTGRTVDTRMKGQLSAGLCRLLSVSSATFVRGRVRIRSH